MTLHSAPTSPDASDVEPRSGGPGPTAMTPVVRATWRVDVSDAIPLPGRFEIAIDVVAPQPMPRRGPPVVLACLPGGFLSRQYFDLAILEEDANAPDRSFSFAEWMAREGFVTLAFDHVGVGESSKPDPIEGGYSLGVEEIAMANQRALELSLDRLASGDPATGIPAISNPETFGVGHSMGSALSVEQQALASCHRGLVLFSFTSAGVPRFLNDAQREVAHRPDRARAELARLTRETMGSPYPPGSSRSEEDSVLAFGIGTAPAIAQSALQSATTNLLGMAGLLCMLPGGFRSSAERIDVPVLIALGDHDLHDEVGLSETLPRSPRVETFVLEDSWHCHFVANTRNRLFAHVANWIRAEVASRSHRSTPRVVGEETNPPNEFAMTGGARS